MKLLKATTTLLALGLTTWSVAGSAADPIDPGQREYARNCVVCHGSLGKGDGPYATLISAKIPDLTRLSSGNGGVFPVSRVYGVLDGTRITRGHGTIEMPIWGNTYKARAAEYYVDAPYDEGAFVKVRILGLIDYLSRLQEK